MNSPTPTASDVPDWILVATNHREGECCEGYLNWAWILRINVFQADGMDEHGRVVLRKMLKRDQGVGFFANLLPCLIGIEDCGRTHYWAQPLAP